MKEAMMAAKAKHGSALAESQPKPSKEQMHYEAQDHLRKLTDAFDIMADPEKMKRVHALAGRHHKAIKSLSQLKQVRDAFNEAENAKEDKAEGGMEE